MRHPIDYLKQRLRKRMTRRRYTPRTQRGGVGTTAKLSLVILFLILLFGAILELRPHGDEAALLEHAAESAVRPVGLIADAARSHRLIFLANVPGSLAPKRLAMAVIDTLARSHGLDVVAFDVDADQQPWIDRYIESKPEDASILLAHPRTLREAEGMQDAYLAIYRRVWRLNQRLGADRRIRVLAVDDPGWPAGGRLSTGEAAVRFSRRDAHMFERVRNRILNRSAQARVLFFVDGLHVLRATAQVGAGGTAPTPMTLLAGIFEENYPHEVYSIVTDAAFGRVVNPEVASYRSTRILETLRDGRPGGYSTFALRAHRRLDILDDMIITTNRPGITLKIVPADYRLADLIDAYVFLGN